MGFVVTRGGYSFAYSGSESACRAVLSRMLSQGWTLASTAGFDWGSAVLSAGAL